MISKESEEYIRLSVGGAISTSLLDDAKYQPMTIVLVLNTNLLTETSPSTSIVRLDSKTGLALTQYITELEPWKWESLRAIPFANHVLFSGRIGAHQWTYSCVYPDRNVETFVSRWKEIRETEAKESDP